MGSVPDDSTDLDDNWMLGFEKFLLIDSIDALNFHFVEEVEVVPSPGKARPTMPETTINKMIRKAIYFECL